MSNQYICKPRNAILTDKGIVGSPKDPASPDKKEIITAASFKNGQKTIDGLLERKDCPIMEFIAVEAKQPEETPAPAAPDKPEAKQPEIKPISDNKPKGAERK